MENKLFKLFSHQTGSHVELILQKLQISHVVKFVIAYQNFDYFRYFQIDLYLSFFGLVKKSHFFALNSLRSLSSHITY